MNKSARLVSLSVGLVIVVVLALFLTASKDVYSSWFDDAWQYRKSITFVHNTNVGSERRVSISVNTQELISAGKMQSDCDDVLFTDISGGVLRFQLTGSCNNVATTFDVVFPSVVNGSNPAYIYYGNLTTGSLSQNVSSVTSLSPSGSTSTGSEEKGLSPALYLKFDEGFGATAYNSTAQAGNGTLSGPTWRVKDECIAANCLSFDGTNDVVTVSDSPGINLEAGLAGAFTIQGWVKVNSLGENGVGQIFNKGSDTYIRVTEGSSTTMANLQASVDLSTSNATLTITDGITFNRWHHVAMTYTDDSEDEITLYIDGVVRGTSTNGSGSPVESGAEGETSFPTIEATNSSATTSTSATSHTVSLPSGVASGNLLVIFFRTGSTSTTHTLSGWNTVAARDSTGLTTIFWKIADGTEGGSVNVTSGAGRASVHNSYRISGFDESDPIAAAFTSTQSVNPPSLDPGWGTSKTLWLAMANTRRTDNSFTAPTDYTNIVMDQSNASSTSTNHVRLATARRFLEASSEDPVAFGTSGTTNNTHAATVAINSAPGLIEANDILIGGPTTANYHGFIDEFKVYGYARSQEQMKRDYAARGGAKGVSAQFGEGEKKALSDGLVGYWKLDETASPAVDYSGNGNDGTWSGNTARAAGKFGGSATFDGTNDHISIADNDLFSPTTTNQFTVSAWLNPATVSVYQEPISKGSGSQYEWQISTNAFGYVTAQLLNNSGGTTYMQAQYTTGISANQWVHVAFTVDLSVPVITLYINGVAVAESTATSGSHANGTAPLRFGERGDGNNDYNGRIDEVRIYNRTLSAQEVQKLYGWTPGPHVHYSFDQNSGTTTVTDISGGGRHGTMNGSIPESAWIPGKYGSALRFDGTNDYIGVPDLGTLDNYTFSAWINSNYTINSSTVQSRSIWGKTAGTGADIYIEWAAAQGGALRFRCFNASGDDLLTTTTTWNEGTWYHIGMVYDHATTTRRIYVNGVLESTSSSANCALTPHANGSRLGDDTSSSWWYNGKLDDVRWYDHARSHAQIMEDMNGGHPAVGTPIGSTVVHLPLNEGYGDTAYDRGPYALNGNLAGSSATCPAASSACPTWTQEGKIGKALIFDGVDDYVMVPHDASQLVTTGLTVAGWIYPSGLGESSAGRIIDKSTDTTAAGGFGLYMNTGPSLRFQVNGGTAVDSPSGSITLSEWNHVVVSVQSSGAVTYYINGRQVGSSASTAALSGITTTNALCIGNRSASGSCNTDRTFDGRIDDIKLYPFALTAEEARVEYNKSKTASFGALGTTAAGVADDSSARSYCVPGDTTSCSPPVLELLFDEATGTSTAADTSGNNHTATLNGSRTLSDWVVGKVGPGLNFDGSDDTVVVSSSSTLNGLSNVTLSMWIYSRDANPVSADKAFVNFFSSTTDRLYLYIRSGSNQLAAVNNIDAGSTTTNLGYTPLKNEWIHLTMTIDGSNWRFYKDGIFLTTISSTKTIADVNSGWQFILGSRTAGTNAVWDGYIDHVRLYDYVRTPAQIAWDYNNGKPVAHYKMDECTGATIYNSAVTGNDLPAGMNGTLTIGGSGSQTTIGTCSTSGAWANGADGKRNASLSFDGTDDGIAVPDPGTGSALDLTSFTLATWIYPNAFPGGSDYTSFIDKGAAFDNNYYFELYGSSELSCGFYSGGFRVHDTTLANLSTGQWAHAVCVFDDAADTIKIYVNGREVLSSTETASPVLNNTNLFIGRNGGGSAYFNGKIDDVRIYNYPLTAQQVKMVMNDGAVSFR